MFSDRFSERAAAYASCRPTYPAALASWLADAAPARERAWDAGCGSGQLSVLLAEHFEEVIASDASAAQLGHARAHARVHYVCAAAEASGLADASMDLAVAAQAAHWFDRPRWFAEVERVTRPRGIVALITYGLAVIEPAIDALVRRFHHEDVGRHWAPERRLVDDGYRTIEFPFDEIVAPRLAIRERWTADAFIGYVGTWSAVHELRRAGKAAKLDDFAAAVRAAWGGQAREVAWPLAMRVGRLPG